MRRLGALLLVGVFGCAPAAAQNPPFLSEPGWTALLNGRDLDGWQAQEGKASAWFTTSQVIHNGPEGKTANLVTTRKFGDVELYIEFLIPKGSNSGVYLHGLYEIQILDSFGAVGPGKTSDCGAVYHRWIDGRPVGGSPPSTNASRAPGEWQSFRIWFRAPRFDSSGNKTASARFLRVLHNGVAVQENVEVEGPTRAHMNHAEAARNPLMIQGDHGPVACRNIQVRPLEANTQR